MMMTIDACSTVERDFEFTDAVSIKYPFAQLAEGKKQFFAHWPWRSKKRHRVVVASNDFGSGKAVAMVDVVGCRPMTPDDGKHSVVKFSPDLFVWNVSNVNMIEPFDVSAKSGFFKVETNKIKIISA